MTSKNRPVEDRQKALEPVVPEANFTLFGVRRMYEGMGVGSSSSTSTISGYCRTQIFEFPRIDFRPGDEPQTIYASPSVQAVLLQI